MLHTLKMLQLRLQHLQCLPQLMLYQLPLLQQRLPMPLRLQLHRLLTKVIQLG
jgi:hypothetical protein